MEYKTVYFGTENGQFVESIGGPYIIPFSTIVIVGIGIVVLIIYLIRLSKKK